MLILALGLAACEPSTGGAPAPTNVTEAQAGSALAAMNLAEPGRISWADRSFADGAFTFTDLTFTDADLDAPITAQSLVLSAPRLEEDGVRFDRLEILGLGLQQPDEVELALARIIVDRPGPALSQWIADGFNARDPEIDFAREDFARWAFADLGLEGLQLAVQETDSGPASISLERFGGRGFDGSRLDEMAMEQFSLSASDAETGDVRAELESFSFEGVSASFMRLMMASGGGEALSMPMNPAEMFDAFAMRGLDMNIGGALVEMPAMTASAQTRGDEVRQTSAMERLTLSADPSGPLGMQLQGGLALLGYEQINMSMVGESVYDLGEDRARTVGENYVLIEDALRIDVGQDMSGVQAYLDRYMAAIAAGEFQDGAPPMEIFEPLVIHGISVRIEDLSLLDRALSAAALMQGTTPETLRLQVSGMIGLGLAAAPAEIPRPLVASLGQALSQFIQNGGSIEIELAPSAPVSVGELVNNQVDAQALGITVTSEAPAE
ncbi:MAG: hypothetical protein AAFX09_04470 [Pseudomonadota bacterium]